jgi:hypothetical protein
VFAICVQQFDCFLVAMYPGMDMSMGGPGMMPGMPGMPPTQGIPGMPPQMQMQMMPPDAMAGNPGYGMPYTSQPPQQNAQAPYGYYGQEGQSQMQGQGGHYQHGQ